MMQAVIFVIIKIINFLILDIEWKKKTWSFDESEMQIIL